jgi:GrpB-like predicted nucleotidyltransferase (UPF0157 family)
VGTGDEEDLDERLDEVLIGGREQREVVIVDYSPAWPERFYRERRRIEAALGPTARRIEHIGSTAVPGLAAKPVVDLLVTVDDPDDEAAYVPRLEAAGYVLRVREPGHRMLRTPQRDVHVHVWAAGSDEERRHLVFRDRLRASPEDRAEYERQKRALARRWRDVNYYARAKTPVVERIMERAGWRADPSG